MGVYIKGIDMPKEPWDCTCHNGETGQCKVIHIGCYDCIPKNCPLVEVPTPHGRLIDVEKTDVLDKIISEIEQHRRKTQGIDPYDLVGDCLDIIDKYKAESEE